MAKGSTVKRLTNTSGPDPTSTSSSSSTKVQTTTSSARTASSVKPSAFGWVRSRRNFGDSRQTKNTSRNWHTTDASSLKGSETKTFFLLISFDPAEGSRDIWAKTSASSRLGTRLRADQPKFSSTRPTSTSSARPSSCKTSKTFSTCCQSVSMSVSTRDTSTLDFAKRWKGFSVICNAWLKKLFKH